jgi:hypothetical protein
MEYFYCVVLNATSQRRKATCIQGFSPVWSTWSSRVVAYFRYQLVMRLGDEQRNPGRKSNTSCPAYSLSEHKQSRVDSRLGILVSFLYFHPLKHSNFYKQHSGAGLSNAAPVIYFPGALFYSAGFNVNQNFKKKYFWITARFSFFRSTPMNTVFRLLQSCFLLYPFYCPLTPTFPFSLEKAPSQVILQTNNTSEPTLLWVPIIIGVS